MVVAQRTSTPFRESFVPLRSIMHVNEWERHERLRVCSCAPAVLQSLFVLSRGGRYATQPPGIAVVRRTSKRWLVALSRKSLFLLKFRIIQNSRWLLEWMPIHVVDKFFSLFFLSLDCLRFFTNLSFWCKRRERVYEYEIDWRSLSQTPVLVVNSYAALWFRGLIT